LNSVVCHIYFIQALQNEIIYISRPIDKKKIVFYNDKTAALPVDEEFQKLWRSVAVESMDDQKIEEYLEKQVSNIGILCYFTATGLSHDEGIFPGED
jgi:predicted transport protein